MTLEVVLQGIDKLTPILAKGVEGFDMFGEAGDRLTNKLGSVNAGLEATTAFIAAAAGAPPRLAGAIGKLTTKFTPLGNVMDKISKLVEKHEERVDKVREAYQKLRDLPGKVLQGLKEGWDRLMSSLKDFAKFAIGAAGVVFILGKLVDKIEGFVEGAAELEGVNAAFLAIAGEGAPALMNALRLGSSYMVESIDLMKAYNDAALLTNKTVADMLPKAMEYLTKISRATGASMEYLLSSWVRGIGRLSPRIIDNMRVTTNLAEMTAFAAQMFGVAEDELSDYEKRVGAATLVNAKLEQRTSGLAEVYGTLIQQMAQEKVMRAENAKFLATIFLPVAKSFYEVLNKIHAITRKNITEGGKWYKTLRTISATISVVIDMVGELAAKFSGAGADAVDSFANKMFEAAFRAFSWGANIVSNLAIGIVRGATTALISAINFISNILGYWMRPGSAPRFLPNLLAWGASAFTEWLRGFTEGDYDVLKGIQSPLMAALQNLVSVGAITGEDLVSTYTSISEAMARALSTGVGVGNVLAQLIAIGGEFGDDLARQFTLLMDAAAATDAVAEAKRRLQAAQSQETAAGKALSRQAREYNRLLREGASQEELRAKMAEMKASYVSLEAAREAAEIAEGDLDTAQEMSQEASRLARLQADLLRQLVEMARLREIAAGAPGIPGVPGDDEWGDLPFADQIPSLDQAFIDLKERIRARFQELWDELKLDWEASGVGTLLNDLKEKWEGSELKLWFEEFILDVKEEGVKTALSNLWLKLAPTIQGWLDDKDVWWAEVWRAFTQEGVEDGSGKVDFGAAFDALWEAVKLGWSHLMFKFGMYVALSVSGQKAFVDTEGVVLGDSFAGGFTRGTLLGLESYTDSIKRGFVKIFDLALRTVREFLGITGGTSSETYKMGKSMGKGIVDGFNTMDSGMKFILNRIIWYVERAVNGMIDGVNRIIQGLRSLPGAGWLNTIGHVSLPRLEKGGLVQATEQLALLHGPEVVLPMDDPKTINVLSQALAAAIPAAGGGDSYKIDLHFNRDSVRSTQDIRDIADALSRSMRLQGVKVAM